MLNAEVLLCYAMLCAHEWFVQDHRQRVQLRDAEGLSATALLRYSLVSVGICRITGKLTDVRIPKHESSTELILNPIHLTSNYVY